MKKKRYKTCIRFFPRREEGRNKNVKDYEGTCFKGKKGYIIYKNSKNCNMWCYIKKGGIKANIYRIPHLLYNIKEYCKKEYQFVIVALLAFLSIIVSLFFSK